MNQGVFYEAFAVGVLAVLIGVVLHYVMLKTYGPHDLNNTQIFAVHLFAIGVVIHLLCEIIGVNKWYCANGVACR